MTIIKEMNRPLLPMLMCGLLPFVAQAQYSLFDITSASSSQDTVCVGIPVQFNDLSYCPWDVMNEWTWDFGDGGMSNLQHPSYVFNSPGTYPVYLYANNILNCGNAGYTKNIVVIGTPMVNVYDFDPSCFGQCDGSLTAMSMGPLMPDQYYYSWAGGQTGVNLPAQCAGVYDLTVTDNYGCSALFPVELIEPDQVTLSPIVGPTQVCDGDLVTYQTVASGGSPFSSSYFYDWFSDGNVGFDNPSQPLVNMDVFDQSPFIIGVSATDDMGCVSDPVYLAVGIYPGTIQGLVTVDGQPCINCPIEIYKWDLLSVWDSIPNQMTSTAADGSYEFSVPPYHDYIIRVKPDLNDYPQTCQTYAGNSHNFMMADQMSMGCDQLITEDIEVIVMPTNTGTCTITGNVYAMAPWTGKMAEEDPIPLIDVVVEKIPPGGSFIMSHDITAIDGQYSFDFMPVNDGDEYVIHVDIPGVPMAQTYNITVNQGDVLFADLDFCVTNDQAVIEVITCNVTGIRHETVAANDISIALSPNPTEGPVRLDIAGLGAEGTAAIVVTDVAGRAVFNTSTNLSLTDLDLGSLAPGVYTLQAAYNGHTAQSRVVIGR
jgi:PKD repeat protein